jgi:hypothetical protein
MIGLGFNEWLILQEASTSEAQERFAAFNQEYILPFAKNLLDYSKKNKSFLTSEQKKEIKAYVENESEEQTPYGIAMNAGNPEIFKVSRIVSTLHAPEFSGGMSGHTDVKYGGIGSGFLARTYHIIVKDPSSDYIFKKFKTFSDYLKWISGREWLVGRRASLTYNVDSFNGLIYYMLGTRLKSAIQKAARKLRGKAFSMTDQEGGEMQVGGGISHDKPFMAIPREIQTCLGDFFNKEKDIFLAKIKKHAASMSSPENFDDIKARYAVWHYLICLYMKENYDKMGYENIRSLYEKFLEIESAQKSTGGIYRVLLMSFRGYSDNNLRTFITNKLKTDSVAGKLGLTAVARRIFDQVAPCGSPDLLRKEAANSMPELHGIKDWFKKHLGDIVCRKRPAPASIAGMPQPATPENTKIDFLIETFLDATFPSRDFHYLNFRTFNVNLAYNLRACVQAHGNKQMQKSLDQDDTSEEEEFSAGG